MAAGGTRHATPGPYPQPAHHRQAHADRAVLELAHRANLTLRAAKLVTPALRDALLVQLHAQDAHNARAEMQAVHERLAGEKQAFRQ
jgi:hypothetical protein